MRPERATALQLRRSGQSYNEISRSLGVPKSTLATWFRQLTLPQELIDRLYDRARSAGTQALVERNKRQTALAAARAQAIQQAAQTEIGRLSRRELQLIGAALYWAEGVRRYPQRGGRRVAFSNADSAAVILMMRFFREVCDVPLEKIRSVVSLAPGLETTSAVSFWSSLTKIPPEHFTVYQGLSRSSKQRRPRFRLPYGTLQLRIADTRLFYRIMGWIQGIQTGWC